MMFSSLEIEKLKSETKDCISIQFKLSEEQKQQFKFEAGQYLTLKLMVNGNEERRSYSICSAPHEKVLKIAAKRIPNGIVSNYLNDEIKEGDKIEVMAPMGNFTLASEARKKVHLAFAAGSGITPVISIIKDILHSEPKSEFHLYYGNKTRDSIIFREELEALEQANKKIFGKRFKVNHYLSQEKADGYENGRIDEEVLREAIRRHLRADEFYLCGPEELIQNARSILNSKAIESSKVHFELFHSESGAELKTEIQESVGNSLSKVKVILDGSESEFEMNPKDSVLHAAIDRGLDVPYACQGGTCCTCQALLLEGEVHMDLNMVLSEEEVEKGYILTCQSHPTSSSIVVNYDEA